MFENTPQPPQPPQPNVGPTAMDVKPPSSIPVTSSNSTTNPSGAAAIGSNDQKVYTMPGKFMPERRTGMGGSTGGKKRLFIIIGIIVAVLLIVLAIIVYAFQVSTVPPQEESTTTNTNATINTANINNANSANTNTNAGLGGLANNGNTNSAATLNLNVNEDLNKNINQELFPNSNTNTNTNSNTNTNVSEVLLDRSNVTDTRDKDRDSLTDIEEEVYGTDANLPDTDKDGFVDGAEVANLFSPAEPKETLLQSGTVIEYTNKDKGWSILYPSQWVAEPLNDTNNEVLFTADTVQGEFVQVTVIDNPGGESIAEWFASLYDDIDPEDLKEYSAGGVDGIVTPDGFTVYVGNKNTIIGILYNFGSKEKINFRSTFAMMLNSFEYTGKKPQNNVNANTNTNTNTNSNTNTNAAANTNQ